MKFNKKRTLAIVLIFYSLIFMYLFILKPCYEIYSSINNINATNKIINH